MKVLMLTLALLSASSAWAVEPAPEMKRLMRAVVSNPSVSATLRAENIDGLTDYTITEVKDGVSQYVLNFTRECFCIPASAKVTIDEDRTPARADGPIEYKTKIEISE